MVSSVNWRFPKRSRSFAKNAVYTQAPENMSKYHTQCLCVCVLLLLLIVLHREWTSITLYMIGFDFGWAEFSVSLFVSAHSQLCNHNLWIVSVWIYLSHCITSALSLSFSFFLYLSSSSAFSMGPKPTSCHIIPFIWIFVVTIFAIPTNNKKNNDLLY